MNLTMRKKLTISVIAMILLILIILAGVQIITISFKNVSDKLILEYHELHALQEFKMSLNKFSVIVNSINNETTSISDNDFIEVSLEVNEKLEKCHQMENPLKLTT